MSLGVSYIADRRTKRTADQAAQLSFQTKKNELGLEITKQLTAEQRRFERVRKKVEDFEQMAKRVEALGIPTLSDQAREFRNQIRQRHQEIESPELASTLHGIFEELDELPAERGTSRSLIGLEEARGKVQQMALLSEETEAGATSIISSLDKAIEFYRGLVIRFTKGDDAPEESAE